MWIKSLDLILDKLKITGCELNNVKAIAGSAQQHGTVYWKKGANEILSNLDSSKFLHLQLQNAFALRETPIWQDSSTETECTFIEEQIGGAYDLARITGLDLLSEIELILNSTSSFFSQDLEHTAGIQVHKS